MVPHIAASLRIPDLPLAQQMAHRLSPGRMVCLLSQGCVKVKCVRVPERNPAAQLERQLSQSRNLVVSVRG